MKAHKYTSTEGIMTDISQNVMPLTLGSITGKVSGIMNSYHQDFLQIRHGVLCIRHGLDIGLL